MADIYSPDEFMESEGNPDPALPLDHINEVGELPDGSLMYEVGAPDLVQAEPVKEDFYSNLAAKMSEPQLLKLGYDLLEAVSQDLESRQEWDKTVNLSFKYLGLKIEEFRSMPFLSQACSAFDSTLSSALLRFFSVARAELFPASGPARSEIVGIPTAEVEDEGERVKIFINHYLTKIDKDYYSDSERLLMYLGFFGCAFRKVYQDPILKRPLARFVAPQDFIVNNHTTSLLASSRLTEVLQLSRKDILLRQQSGDFIEFKLPALSDDDDDDEDEKLLIKDTIKRTEGIDLNSSENKSLFKFYEMHCDLTDSEIEAFNISDSDNNEMPKPYIVTICTTTKKVVSIRRNWKENDDTYQRREYYVHYVYLAGFGIYGLGLAQLGGSNSIVMTSILRQLIDAGSLRNFPGGLIKKGMRLDNNDKEIGFASWAEIDTRTLPIQDCIMPMPYGEPSQVLMALRQELKAESAALISAVESKIPELGMNAPVGTTLALLEVATQLQSCVLRSLHASLGYELQLLYNLFGEYLPDTPYPFAVPGKEAAIMRKDFNDKIRIVPVSDPNVLTSTHRLMRNEALLKLVQSAPNIHDIREAYRRMYQSMNIENIDQILPPPPAPESLDPSTENMVLLNGGKVTTGMYQDDEVHNLVHKKFAESPAVQANPAVNAAVIMHIQEHKCMKAFKELQKKNMEQNLAAQLQQSIAQGMHPQEAEFAFQQQMQSFQLPEVRPEDKVQILKMPEVQNIVAQMDAEEIMQELQRQQEQAAHPPLDINQVALADVEQKRESSHLKAEEVKEKIAADILKTKLQYEAEMAKTQSQRDTAREKHEVDLLIAENRVKPNYGE